MNKLLYRICLSAMALGCLLSASANAQTPAPAAADANLFPGATALGETLKNDGIYPLFDYTEVTSSLVSGGLQRGTMPAGELAFGVGLDLQTIMGIPGASFHILFDERNGIGVGAISGTQGPLQGLQGPTRSTRLTEFYWEQTFSDNKVDVQIGRMQPNNNFASSDVSCQFISSIICSQPGTWYDGVNRNQSFPVSTWGGLLSVTPGANTYMHLGIYDDDPSQANPNQYGFNWNVSGSVGVFIPVEFGYQTDFTTSLLPSHYDVGFYWDDASYTDGVQTQLGSYPVPNGINKQGRTAYWVQAQQTVWRPDPKTNQSLTVFAGAQLYNGGSPYWSQYYAGLLDRAPWGPVRANDTIALVGSYYANNQNEHPNKATQWIYELNYGLEVIPGITFKPFVQYVVAPNNFLAPAGSKQPNNALVLGALFAVDLNDLFTFPRWVAH
jgi:porin